jgi:energy-coupling factor transporter ATP-binding protein EcfA2
MKENGNLNAKRVTVLTGHYGSGKTSLAVNWALRLSESGRAVTVADLDIVNPYFRTTDRRRELEARGIRLIASQFANSNLDLPALPAELYSVVESREGYAVLDVGGDDRGAVALGRYAPFLLAESDYEMLFVVNFCRPLTRTALEALGVLREVEAACGLPATALVNNSNLGRETTADTILKTVERMQELSQLAGLPVKMTAVSRELKDQLEGNIENLFPMDL